VSHPRHQLDPVFHNSSRFSVMAVLVAADNVEFRFVRDTVEVSDSALSQHVTALENAGYVTVVKGQVARRPRTWLSSTPGCEAFARHVNVLDQIVRPSIPATARAAEETPT
jgi:DNA-binding MarR family transcriptional regulator